MYSKFRRPNYRQVRFVIFGILKFFQFSHILIQVITIKLPYSIKDNRENFDSLLWSRRRQQSVIIRSTYNRLLDGKTNYDVEKSIRGKLDNVHLDSWELRSGVAEGISIFSSKMKPIVFGGKANLHKRATGKISSEEWKRIRTQRYVSVGERLQKGNRKFRLDIENGQIIFKPSRGVKFQLEIPRPRGNYLDQLVHIQHEAGNKQQPFSVKLDESFIHLTFEPKPRPVGNLKNTRVMSIDMNPNEIGYSILEFGSDDNMRVVDCGVISNDTLNGTDVSANKRTFEVYNISKWLIQQCIHFKCAKFVVEDLTVKNKNHNFGRNVNRLINNNWCRSRLIANIAKRCQVFGVELVKANPCYSSFIGNALHGVHYPDPICSAIEIGRRGFFKFVKSKFYPKLIAFENLPNQWKKEVDRSYESWLKLFNDIKKAEIKYHFSWKDSKERFKVFELGSHKSKVYFVRNCTNS